MEKEGNILMFLLSVAVWVSNWCLETGCYHVEHGKLERGEGFAWKPNAEDLNQCLQVYGHQISQASREYRTPSPLHSLSCVGISTHRSVQQRSAGGEHQDGAW